MVIKNTNSLLKIEIKYNKKIIYLTTQKPLFKRINNNNNNNKANIVYNSDLSLKT